jgi:hypothetical protein
MIMFPPDRLADLLPQEARTHPERPDFPSVALLIPDRICCGAGSRWKGFSRWAATSMLYCEGPVG